MQYPNSFKNKFIIFIIFIFFIFLDFFSKKIIFNTVDLNTFLYVTSFFDLTHIHNFGISFGFFSALPSWFFILVGVFLILIVIYMLLLSRNNYEKVGFFMIISGGSSNIFDRILNGYVIDFIYLHYEDFYWPAFNFADIYISLGVLIIILRYFNDMKKKIKN